MGTRGTIRIRKGGKEVVMYNHWDSYLSGLGVEFLKDVQSMIQKYGIDGLIEKIENVKIVTEDISPTEEDIAYLEKYTDLTVGCQDRSSWYCLLRRLQGDLMGMIEVGYLYDVGNINYEEYNYVLDLDLKGIFYTYNKLPPLVPDTYIPFDEIDSTIEKWNESRY